MREEIEEIRRALIQIDALDDKAIEALATLDSAIGEIDAKPEAAHFRGVVSETAGTLGGNDAEAEGGLAGKWRELKERISDWEEDHPSLVLAVGRISDSLAAVGL